MKKKKGFTLVELIAVMLLMSLAMGVIIKAFSSTLKLKDMQGANCENVQNVKISQAKIFNDIRKTVKTVDTVYDDVSKTYSFVDTDTNVVNCENYCKAHSLRPLIYMEKIDNSISCYAYDKDSKSIHNVIIPQDTTESVEAKYYPDSYELSSITQPDAWDVLQPTQYAIYQNNPPTPQIPADTVVIDHISITRANDDTVYNQFNIMQAFHDSTTGHNYVILQSKILAPDNTLPYFIVKLTDNMVAYYKNIYDRKIAESISSIDIKPSSTFNEGKYYDIHIESKIGNQTNSVDTRVAWVDYMDGGD